MITLATIWAWLRGVPVKLQIYAGVAVVIVIALLRWRALGIQSAIKELQRKDLARAQRIREQIAVARSNHPDGDHDIIERLRKHGRLRDD